jgi:hypothetical protein
MGLERFCWVMDPGPPPEWDCVQQPTSVRLAATPADGWAVASWKGCGVDGPYCYAIAEEDAAVKVNLPTSRVRPSRS